MDDVKQNEPHTYFSAQLAQQITFCITYHLFSTWVKLTLILHFAVSTGFVCEDSLETQQSTEHVVYGFWVFGIRVRYSYSVIF